MDAHTINLSITHNGQSFFPCVCGEMLWETRVSGTPGKLAFTVLKDEALHRLGGFQEGDRVQLFVGDAMAFSGFVFTKHRTEESRVEVTAYDQLRYLKNRDSFCYRDMTAGKLLEQIARERGLTLGTVEDTGHVLAAVVESDRTLMDILQSALRETLSATGRRFVLYDDAGAITLRSTDSLRLDLPVSAGVAEGFSYTSTIDGDTCTAVKLVRGSSVQGQQETAAAQDAENMRRWGLLQRFETVQDEKTDLTARARALLRQYGVKERNLTVYRVPGDIRVRGGTTLPVYLAVGDLIVNGWMLAHTVRHRFYAGRHTMDLTLAGGEFIA